MKPKEDDLFAWSAEASRNEAIERVVANTPEWFKANYYRLMAEQAPGLEVPFTGEDFRFYAEPRIGHPHHQNSWGGLWNGAVRRGWVIATGRRKQMEGPLSNARKTDLYRWPERGIQCDL